MKKIIDTTDRTSLTPWEKRGKRYRRRSINNMEVYIWAMIKCRNKKVLDVGCGKGDGMNMLSMFSKELWGADFSLTELKHIKYHHYYCPVKVFQLDVEKEWFDEGEHFETIVCFETLEHLHHPEIALAKFAKSCNQLLFSVPHNAPSRFHPQVFKSFDEVKALVEPYFDVEWWFERKHVVRQEPFNVPYRYIGIGTPK
jgi:2-polyprenyl-3-methyl-5-hydroxy-6-metoxy-1,4-benzoquinol methylase